MKNMTRTLSIVALVTLLAGCAGGPRDNEIVGTGVGAGLGGFLGSQVGGGKGKLAATAIGVLIGAVIGNNVGSRMDTVDRQNATRSFETAPSNQPVRWNNPDTGQHTVVAQPAVIHASGQPCREYVHKVYIGGKLKEGYGTACRQADGSWQLQ
jgi:surface antigen